MFISILQAKVVVTASCGIDSKGVLPYKPLVDEAIKFSKHKPQKCVVYQRDMVCIYMLMR